MFRRFARWRHRGEVAVYDGRLVNICVVVISKSYLTGWTKKVSPNLPLSRF